MKSLSILAASTVLMASVAHGQQKHPTSAMAFTDSGVRASLDLNDLHAMPLFALVRPVGAPVVEQRPIRGRFRGQTELTFLKQSFAVLDGPNAGQTIAVLAPVYFHSLLGPQTSEPPLAGNRYLVFGEAAHEGLFRFAPNEIGLHLWAENADHVLQVSSRADNEYMGWALAATDLERLPSAPSPEQVVYDSLASSIHAEANDPWHTAFDILRQLEVGMN